MHEVEVIGLEIARRLHFGLNFSFAEIDGLECFAPNDEGKPKSIFHQLRLSRNHGLLSDVQKRLVIPAWDFEFALRLTCFYIVATC